MEIRYLIVIFTMSCPAGAQSLGTFAATGHMTTSRTGHTATLLTDGKVMIAGGYQSQGSSLVGLKSAEIYDPSSASFTHTGDMSAARIRNTATLLPDGRVLIAGSGSAEVYDPGTGTFSPAGKMNSGGATAILLNNGKVLLAGGGITVRQRIHPMFEFGGNLRPRDKYVSGYRQYDKRPVHSEVYAPGRRQGAHRPWR